MANGRGQGLKFEGYPTDVEEFIHVLAVEGCHPKAAERILSRIREKGFDLLSVMDGVNFKFVRRRLEKIGVSVYPIPVQEDRKEKYDNGYWPEGLVDEVMEYRKSKNYIR